MTTIDAAIERAVEQILHVYHHTPAQIEQIDFKSILHAELDPVLTPEFMIPIKRFGCDIEDINNKFVSTKQIIDFINRVAVRKKPE